MKIFIDKDQPPKPMIYKEQGHHQKCHCHSRELVPGQKVLLWPNPQKEGAFWIICEDFQKDRLE